jgi:hypothetical protein
MGASYPPPYPSNRRYMSNRPGSSSPLGRLWANCHGVGELLHLPEALDELYEFDYEFDEHKQEKYAEPEDEHDPQDEQDQNYQAGQIYREADYRQPVVEVPELVEREPLVHVHRQLRNGYSDISSSLKM